MTLPRRSPACSPPLPREIVYNQIYNVGNTRHNYQVREIAEIVAETFPGCALRFGTGDKDNRSYRVSFEKIATQLPRFACWHEAPAGAQQLCDIFERIGMTREIFEAPPYTRLKMIQQLIRTKQLDGDLFWRS